MVCTSIFMVSTSSERSSSIEVPSETSTGGKNLRVRQHKEGSEEEGRLIQFHLDNLDGISGNTGDVIIR